MEIYDSIELVYDPEHVEKQIEERKKSIHPFHVMVPCPLCDTKPFYHLFRCEKGDLGQCMKCGHIYATVRLSDEALKLYYAPFVPGFLINDTIKKRDSVRRPILNNRDLDIIESYKTPGMMLEVGAAAGDFLVFARRRGWQIAAQDLSHICKPILDQLGILSLIGFAWEAGYHPKVFDVIVMRHTLEHLPYPRRELSALRYALKDDGIIYITVPPWRGIEVCRQGGHNFPAHISHYTEDSLKLLFYLTGFEILTMEKDEENNLRVIVEKESNYEEDN